ncbi:MAG: leucine-rich repeat protein [Eubacterium sp.]|nr:leucine-rich repeat protein [Eubacterium sp.]
MLIVKKNVLFRKIASLLLCIAFFVPGTVCRAQERNYHTSGIYTYYILDELKKEISICAIDSTEKKIIVPSELDGYRVCALGYESYAYDNYENFQEMGGKMKEHMEELVIPTSVRTVWAFAFKECKRLSKVSLPEGITLGYASFSGCNNWKDIVLPYNTICEESALPSDHVDTLQISNSIMGENIFFGVIQKMILSVKKDTVFSLAVPWVSVTVKQLISPKDATKLMFNFSDGESRVEKLYVNGKQTKIEANAEARMGYVTEGHVTFGEIYTVEGAEAIRFAKKNKIKYHVKRTAEVKKVIRKKKANTFLHTWKKAKTTILSCCFDKKRKTWKKSTKKVPAVYEIYGRKGKKGKYQQVGTTKQKKVKTKYKYVKVKPVSEWDE